MRIKFFSLRFFIQIANFAQGQGPSGKMIYDRFKNYVEQQVHTGWFISDYENEPCN